MPTEQAAVLLLREVCGFERDQVAEILAIGPVSAKNRLQAARKAMREAYREQCALITKKGICYQCPQLDEVYGTGEGTDPLVGEEDRFQGRLKVLKDEPVGTWTRWLSEVLAIIEDG